MGNPLFKSSEGDRFDVLRVWWKITEGELQQVSGMEVLVRLKVRPEAFPSGSLMPVWSLFGPGGSIVTFSGHQTTEDNTAISSTLTKEENRKAWEPWEGRL